MKKTLLAILALILCVSMFAGCGTIIENLPEPSESESNQTLPPQTEEEEEEETIDKKAVMDAFNKIDLSAFAGISIDSTDMLSDLIMQAEFNMSGIVDGEEGEASLGIQVKDNVYHLISTSGTDENNKQITEIFNVIEETGTTIYQKYTDTADPSMSYGWDKIVAENAPDGSAAGMVSTIDPEMIVDMIAKIQIPKLEEKHITAADGMALISNEYIVDLYAANLELFYGEKPDADTIKEARKALTESLTESKFALYLGVNDAGINKMAVGMEADGTKFYAEIALSEDCKALDAVTLKVVEDFGGPGLDYAPESVIVLKPVYAEVEADAEEAVAAIVGADLDMTIYTSAASSIRHIDGSETKSKTVSYQKIVIDTTLNLANIGKANADILTLKMEQIPEKTVDYEVKIDEEYDETVISAKEDTEAEKGDALTIEGVLKSANANQIVLDAALKLGATTIDVDAVLNCTFEENVLLLTGTFVTAGVDLEFSAAVSLEDFTMPELPVVEDEGGQTPGGPAGPNPMNPGNPGGADLA